MKLSFDTDNAAFENNLEIEVVRVLKKVIAQIETGRTDAPILDRNGNLIGVWAL